MGGSFTKQIYPADRRGLKYNLLVHVLSVQSCYSGGGGGGGGENEHSYYNIRSTLYSILPDLVSKQVVVNVSIACQ